jgi:hypothetical protein
MKAVDELERERQKQSKQQEGGRANTEILSE